MFPPRNDFIGFGKDQSGFRGRFYAIQELTEFGGIAYNSFLFKLQNDVYLMFSEFCKPYGNVVIQ